MKKTKNDIYSISALTMFMILLLAYPLFQIYKYGLKGYVDRRIEKRERRLNYVKNIVT
jgi:hypothetical protein